VVAGKNLLLPRSARLRRPKNNWRRGSCRNCEHRCGRGGGTTKDAGVQPLFQMERGSLLLPSPKADGALFISLGLIGLLVFAYIIGKRVAHFLRRSQVRFYRIYRRQLRTTCESAPMRERRADRCCVIFGISMPTETLAPSPSSQTPAEPERLAYSLHEAADLLGVDYFSVYRLIQRGKLQACRALRGKLLVSRSELLRLLRN
jgi:excisionase family DNA binding protein